MALDQLTLLVNKYRRLYDASEDPFGDPAVEKAYDEIVNYLENSNEKVIIKATYSKEVYIKDVGEYDVIIEFLTEDRMTLQEALASDIQQNSEYYVESGDINFIVEDENGKEIRKFDGGEIY